MMMAIQKIDLLGIGKGEINQNVAGTTQAFASNNTPGTYAPATSYLTGNTAEYSGKIYRSLQNSNVGNQPDISPAFWEILVNAIKDGDIAFVNAGVNSDLRQRRGGIWVSVFGTSITVNLPTNTSNYVWLSVSIGSGRNIFMDYSIARNSTRRTGRIDVGSDGSDAAISEFGIVPFGDAGVVLDAQFSGGNVELLATTDNAAGPILLTYAFRSWA